MQKPVLFLMLGFPGAGKTTAAMEIHALTGAVHLWADKIRRERFNPPAYTHQENLELYAHLNTIAVELLAAGNSVVFDTNFNFYKDRQKLRRAASGHGARCVVVWVATSKDIARERATENAHRQSTRVLGDIPIDRFERISSNLEPPQKNETFIRIDGTRISKNYIKEMLEDYL